VERSDAKSDVLVKFMKRSGKFNLSWPSEARKDECWVPLAHVLCTISPPEKVQEYAAQQYFLSAVDYERVQDSFYSFVRNN
jgi:hypothetical protein